MFMKLIHLSDLHIGKRLDDFSLLEDQEYILTQILKIIDDEEPYGVLIAGDVYDKTVPSEGAVELFDDFLYQLAQRGLKVFVISGNHDSPERIAFGSRIMSAKEIYLSPVYDGSIEPVPLSDEFGKINVYLLPFIKPVHVRRFFPEEEIATYTDAMRCVIDSMNVDTSVRNILVTHQFVTGSARSESEDISVGGTDNVDASVFDPFDYVALGHLHKPQNCGTERIRYCGTPLKYSISEAKDQKSVTVVELKEKGSLSVRTVDLIPQHDMVDLRGTFEELIQKSFYDGTTWQEDYTRITLTDEEDIPEAFAKLRVIYRHMMGLYYDNKRTRTNQIIKSDDEIEKKSPSELFSDFFELQNNQPMSDVQSAYVQELIEKIWEEEDA